MRGKLYTYLYEKGVLVSAKKYTATYSNNVPTAKTLVSAVEMALVAVGTVNWWNPVGWIMWGIAAVVLIWTCVEIGIKAGKAVPQLSKGKRTKIPGKLKSGDKVKVPTTHGREFTKNKDDTYTHKKTGWKVGKAKDNHYGGEHWHAAPNKAKTGDYYNVGPNGNILS